MKNACTLQMDENITTVRYILEWERKVILQSGPKFRQKVYIEA